MLHARPCAYGSWEDVRPRTDAEPTLGFFMHAPYTERAIYPVAVCSIYLHVSASVAAADSRSTTTLPAPATAHSRAQTHTCMNKHACVGVCAVWRVRWDGVEDCKGGRGPRSAASCWFASFVHIFASAYMSTLCVYAPVPVAHAMHPYMRARCLCGGTASWERYCATEHLASTRIHK